MKTYVTLTLSSEGGKASEVTEILQNLGFEAVHGNYDFVYDWKTKKVPVEELIAFADKVQSALRGKNVLFQIISV